ncbi:MAG: hypothetical protein KIS75_02715 [Chromatiales bacterium]|nr:hypothetical protein [Chromatiales bacterium]
MSPGMLFSPQISQRDGKLGQFDASGRGQRGAAGIEQQLGRQHEAIADHAHRRVCAEHFTKAAKKVGSVLAQAVHLACECHVETFAEVVDLRGLLGFDLLRRRQRLADLLELATQVVELGVEQRDLGLCIGAQPALFGDCPVTLIDQRRQRLDTDLALLQLALYEQRVLGLQRQFRLQGLAAVAFGADFGDLVVEFRGQLADVRLELRAQLAQAVHVLLQARDQQQLLADLALLRLVAACQHRHLVAQCALVTEQAVDALAESGDLAAEPLAVLLFQAKQVRQFDHALVHHVQLGLLLVEQL